MMVGVFRHWYSLRNSGQTSQLTNSDMTTTLTPLQAQVLAAFERTFGDIGDLADVKTLEQAQQNGDPLLPFVLAQCPEVEGQDGDELRNEVALTLDMAGRHLQRLAEELRVGEPDRIATRPTIADQDDAPLGSRPRG